MQKFFLRRRLRFSALPTAMARAFVITGALLFGSLTAPQLALAQAPAPLDEPTRKLAHDIFQQLIEINTTDSVGNVTTAAKAMQQRLLDAGFAKEDFFVGGPNDRKENMVLRYRGTGAKKPILFIGHLDVVEARREDWTTDPFKFVEKDSRLPPMKKAANRTASTGW
jgi:hypothetical protein